MMGFLQERAALLAQGKTLGPAHLFFGCRSSAEDFIYRSELEGYLASGVLSGLHVAFSREGASKVSTVVTAAGFVQAVQHQRAAERLQTLGNALAVASWLFNG
jgi:sulfite reductase alpha subunit-like flavoprotein